MSLTLNGKALPLVKLSNGRYKGLDLSTLTMNARRAGDGAIFKLNLKYGAPRDGCFLNDDGRNLLSVTFRPGTPPVAFETTYEGCEPATAERQIIS